MPELAEVKLTADYINKYKSIVFNSLSKSSVSKIDTNLSLPFSKFTVDAQSRGKELLLNLTSLDPNYIGHKKLRITLGMSGVWLFYNINDQSIDPKNYKHMHLFMEDDQGNRLGMNDVRRFAKWSWSDFSKDRGPDPLTEFSEFSKRVLTSFKTEKDFKKPLSEVLMNQKWFNGIGNYLRAEILYRLDVSPFQAASNLTHEKMEKLNSLCNECASQAYLLGGGQLKDWKNSDGTDPSSFKEWMKCYGKLESKNDSNGRNFWYDKKWQQR